MRPNGEFDDPISREELLNYLAHIEKQTVERWPERFMKERRDGFLLAVTFLRRRLGLDV